MNEPFEGECGCIRLPSLALENADAVPHLRQRFLRTHKTGQLGNAPRRQREDISTGTHQTPWASEEVALPGRPALPQLEATGTIGQSRRSRALFSSKAGSGGLHSMPEVGGGEAACEAVLFWGHFASCFLLAASSPTTTPSPAPDTEEEKLAGATQSKPLGGCWGVGGPGPSRSLLCDPLSLFLGSPAPRPKLPPAYSAAGVGMRRDE